MRLAVGAIVTFAVPANVRLWPGENKCVPFRRGHELSLARHPSRALLITDVAIEHERELAQTPRATGAAEAGNFWWVVTAEVLSAAKAAVA